MTLSINNLSTNEDSAAYYNPKFCRIIEGYLPYIRNNADNKILPIDPHDLYKYEGDFYGLLDAMDVSRKLHWITLRVNNLTNPTEFGDSLQVIIVPSTQLISNILQKFTTLK